MLAENLKGWAAARGYRLAIADIGIVEAVRHKLEERRSSGMIDPGFYEEYLSTFRYLEGTSIAGARYVIMVAVPSPISVLRVTVGGRKIGALIPPTYIRYNATFKDVLGDMKKNVLRMDAEAEVLSAPLKSLAVHMGMAAYGRNNITYVPGLGSGHQLCGYVLRTKEMSMGACAGAEGRETMLERCASCRACVKACPTGAIREDRFLISAERCFTLLSESRRPMPAWARPPKSLCFIGCMACQQVCPENKGRLTMMPLGIELTAKETRGIIEAGRRLALKGAAAAGADKAKRDPAFASALAKTEPLGMTEDLDVMGRNLDYFLSSGVGPQQI